MKGCQTSTLRRLPASCQTSTLRRLGKPETLGTSVERRSKRDMWGARRSAGSARERAAAHSHRGPHTRRAHAAADRVSGAYRCSPALFNRDALALRRRTGSVEPQAH
jgi:hypothetical protein